MKRGFRLTLRAEPVYTSRLVGRKELGVGRPMPAYTHSRNGMPAGNPHLDLVFPTIVD